MQDKIKVMIVEDDVDWLKALVSFLNYEDGIYVAATATNAEDAINLAGTIAIDVVLMDIRLSEDINYSGIYATMEIRKLCNAKVIMLTSSGEEEDIINSFTAGAVNYISKTRYKEIKHAIEAVCKNENPFEALLKDYYRLKREEQLKELTPSEKELFDLIVNGYSQASISRILYKSERTVKNQVSQILKKLCVNCSKDAVEKVKAMGLFFKERKKKHSA